MTSALRAMNREAQRGPTSPNAPLNKYGFAILLLSASALYFWNLPINGWGNPYYAQPPKPGQRAMRV